MRNLILAFFTAFILSGCASTGQQIDQSSVDQIKIGTTTFDDMLTIFGSPAYQSYGSDGKLSASWMYVYVGPFGTGMEQQILSVLFDDAKRVEKFNMANGRPDGPRLGR